MSELLESILQSAGTRHSLEAAHQEFLFLLMQQCSDDLRLTGIALWNVSRSQVTLISEFGSNTHEASDEAVSSAPTGSVRIDSINRSSSAVVGRRLLSAANLAGDFRLVLDVTEGESAVDKDLVVQLADVFADLQRRRILERHLRVAESDRSLNALIAQLHASLDSEDVANILATDSTAIFEFHRVAVAARSGRHWRVIATTGVSEPNLRSDASRQICNWIEDAAAASIESSAANSGVLVVPLQESKNWEVAQWAAVFEAGTDVNSSVKAQVDRLCHHAALALNNCDTLSHSSVSHQLTRFIRSASRPGKLAVAAIALIALAFLTLWKSELQIEVYGELTPRERAFVFAPDDGTVTDIFVDDGLDVAKTQVLCVLANEDLEVKLESTNGELAAVAARLAAIDALRGDRDSGNNLALMSAERTELQEKVASLRQQASILTERLEQLTVKSRIEGRIHGDRLRQLLFRRPVQRGQFLFEVANRKSGWQLDLRIPEADVRHVLNAMQDSVEPLPVTFALETSPGSFRSTLLESLGSSTDVDSTGRLSTLAVAGVEDDGYANQRPGAGVVAYLHCGPRSIGFVWFRKIIEFVQRHTLL